MAHFLNTTRTSTRIVIIYLTAACLALACFTLSGCGPIGAKGMNPSIVYAGTALLAFILLGCHCLIIHKSSPWLLLMSVSVLVVNLGYFALSVSSSLEEALLANRIAYFGSVFLPMSMLMSIVDIAKVKYPRVLPAILLILAAGVFLVAASPGYSGIYYAEVSLATVNGISTLDKVYGPCHSLYLFYLLGYFLAMIAIVIRIIAKQQKRSGSYAVCLAAAVGVNIGVWLIEQLVHFDFEMLSVSYIISELFLLGLGLAVKAAENDQPAVTLTASLLEVQDATSSEPQAAPEAETQIEDEAATQIASPFQVKATASPETHAAAQAEEATEYGLSMPLKPGVEKTPDTSNASAVDWACETTKANGEPPTALPAFTEDQRMLFLEGLSTLTRTERTIYDLYLDDRSTQEILEYLDITSNTLKFHNKNLYGKLGVPSRKRLVAIARHLDEGKSQG